ncbi:MAG: cobalamin-binding protein [bacterium]|nr:cobalamin-binding protein [bacterium]
MAPLDIGGTDEQADRFEAALLAMDRPRAREVLTGRDDHSPTAFVDKLVMPVLSRIGDAWERGDVALSQVYMSGRICEELLESLLSGQDSARKNHPPMAITVLEDFHMLGKRIVKSILLAGGYNVIDYGRTDVGELIERTVRDKLQILMISTLILPSALRVEEVTAGLRKAGCSAKVIVGGAPFRFEPELYREVGADAMCASAFDIVQTLARITGEPS